jgi:hypothetical protein
MTNHHVQRIAVAFMCSLSLWTVACSAEGDGGDKARATSSSSRSADDQRAEQLDCLRQKGIDIKEGSSAQGRSMDTGDLSEAEIEQALKACRMGAGGGGGGEEMSAQDRDKALQFARCMREEGLDYQDPDLKGGVAQAPSVPPGQEERFEKASRTCADKVY